MAYIALARKWRPGQFNQVIGQDHVLTALSNSLQQQRLHHAYLFSGTRGVGKTTIARLFAKGMNCVTGITATPCGQCQSCSEIAQGRAIDLLEIDAASRTKVEDTRELLDNIQYQPARARFKIYLIDEVHMLSRSSFNALLKTLEEPPPHVKFLFATTDPQKLPVTILSRCLQFHLKPITEQFISRELGVILSQEQAPYEEAALTRIAHAANGSMRDALSLTDQALALGNGQINQAGVIAMLGGIDQQDAVALVQRLLQNDAQALMQLIADLALQGLDWDELIKQLTALFHQLAMTQALPLPPQQSLYSPQVLTELAQAFDPQQIQLFYQMTIQSRELLPQTPNGQMAVEMLFLRMLAFRPAEPLRASAITRPPTEAVPVLSASALIKESEHAAAPALQLTGQPSAPEAGQPASDPTENEIQHRQQPANMQATQPQMQVEIDQGTSRYQASEQQIQSQPAGVAQGAGPQPVEQQALAAALETGTGYPNSTDLAMDSPAPTSASVVASPQEADSHSPVQQPSLARPPIETAAMASDVSDRSTQAGAVLQPVSPADDKVTISAPLSAETTAAETNDPQQLAASIVGLRHQLRSHRLKFQQQRQTAQTGQSAEQLAEQTSPLEKGQNEGAGAPIDSVLPAQQPLIAPEMPAAADGVSAGVKSIGQPSHDQLNSSQPNFDQFAKDQPSLDPFSFEQNSLEQNSPVPHSIATNGQIAHSHEEDSYSKELEDEDHHYDAHSAEAYEAYLHGVEPSAPEAPQAVAAQPQQVGGSPLVQAAEVLTAKQNIEQALPTVAEGETYTSEYPTAEGAVQTVAAQQAETLPAASLRPDSVQSPLFSDSGELKDAIKQEVAQQDDWAALIPQLALPKMIEQLALNATFTKHQNKITLKLRPAHQHLHTEKGQQQLEQSFTQYFAVPCQLEIMIEPQAVDLQAQGQQLYTPLELRERFYQLKLQRAQESLQQDEHVQFMQTHFQASIHQDSIQPVITGD